MTDTASRRRLLFQKNVNKTNRTELKGYALRKTAGSEKKKQARKGNDLPVETHGSGNINGKPDKENEGTQERKVVGKGKYFQKRIHKDV